MRNFYSLPPKLKRGLRLLVVINLCCVVWSVAAFANGKNDKNSAAPPRPVARLITSIRPVVARPAASSMPRERAAILVASAAPIARVAPAAAASNASLVRATSDEQRAFAMVNEQRAANGEEPLVWDAELCRMARAHSAHMAAQNFFDHVGPDGLDMVARAHAANLYGWQALGENIAYNQGFDDPASFAVERWMHSTKHRTNILNAQFSRSGLGVARAADGRIFFTQVFAAR